jgi:hypothetical protein
MNIRTKMDGLDVVYRVYEYEVDEDNFPELIEELHEKALDGGLMAVGHTLYIGYDCEWLERNGNLQVLSYQFYLMGIGGEIAVVFLADERLALKDMLNVIMRIALQTGTILHYPRNIVFRI